MSPSSTSPSQTLSAFLSSRPEYKVSTSRARLSYLYSDLSQARQNNPTSFTSSLSWWSNLLHDVVSSGLQDGEPGEGADKLVWHLDGEFADRLRWEGAGRPTCLGTVALHLSQSGQLIPLQPFLNSVKPVQSSASWPRWLLSNLVGAPLWWSMSKIGIVDSDPLQGMDEAKAWKVASGDWVMLDTLKKAAENVATDLMKRCSLTSSITDRLFTLSSFTDLYASKGLPGVTLSSLDMQVLLKYLQRDRKLVVVDAKRQIIKVLLPEEQSAPQPVEISEEERGILNVKTTSAELEKQIDDLEARIAERQAKIASYLRSNQKALALSHLRSRKALEDLLSKRTLAFENLSSVLLKIEAASGDVSILSAYSSATSSLKSLLARPELQRENVENTMDEMREALADSKEIDDIVKQTGEEVSGLDGKEDEIRDELEEMMKEAEKERAMQEDERKLRESQGEREKKLDEGAGEIKATEGQAEKKAEVEDLREELEQKERRREEAMTAS